MSSFLFIAIQYRNARARMQCGCHLTINVISNRGWPLKALLIYTQWIVFTINFAGLSLEKLVIQSDLHLK